ncbi:hypothetical protein PHSY_006939 [Pseudozyma hubeiensis SY62]|uniref:Uncharacterized protein n=1 Tax=Pseudozyma hubeiensis (strain SY62) TaxID=1305764 RepID=R9PD96_PSEHS|nr:hypothetical protein PHSY_006939 [Pseudozyma hubeiensis SY62]GAC99338.1 hypothetical protein PHSY_006939 [Pseudozyma hubeiensis SY62]
MHDSVAGEDLQGPDRLTRAPVTTICDTQEGGIHGSSRCRSDLTLLIEASCHSAVNVGDWSCPEKAKSGIATLLAAAVENFADAARSTRVFVQTGAGRPAYRYKIGSFERRNSVSRPLSLSRIST